MKRYYFASVISVVYVVCFLTTGFCDMSAEEILKKVAEQGFKESFRAALTIKTIRGKKPPATQAVWVCGKLKNGQADFFFDFDEPQESKGLRFLLQTQQGQAPKVYMYLPATGKTLPVVTDDPSSDIGGTGLNTDDILGFVPNPKEKYSIAREEKIGGQDCWVIQVIKPDNKGERLVWVRKRDFTVVKSEELDSTKKVVRTYKVVEFFKTEDGREFPREEEITIPNKKVRIFVRQENAVFGIELAGELFDPEKFGTFKWKN
ncbi:MAG: outer membrane lipoprotein-sorting protein [Deltaproteobacteria bacterium]|nr:outer membrane lipoprotein-sorting protein [Deltaproteobacteria bacterium]